MRNGRVRWGSNTTIRRLGAFVAGAASLTASTLYSPVVSAQEPAACLSPDPSKWPASSKPYFMIIVDNSGSMGSSVTGSTSCGYQSNRIGHARCAVKNTIQAFSEVNYGLSTYAWRETCPANAGTCANCTQTTGCFTNTNCTATYAAADNNFCGPLTTDPTGPGTIHAGGSVIVPMLQDNYWNPPPNASNVQSLLALVDNNCGNGEIGADSNTPLGGVLFNMNQYFSGTFTDPFSGALASPIGPATFGGVAAERPCRSINIILITDGDETCDSYNGGTYPNGEGLAVYEAGRLWNTGVTVGGQNFRIKTHVIGFVGATVSALNNIAAAGGTGTAYSTANEAQLSAALANIIGGAIKPETCDNTDNNCNGCTDEGFTHYCDVGQTCCAWTTAAQRTTCLTNYKASITAANPQGTLTLLPCTTAAQQTQPANWLCYDPKETCDNVDNNCNGSVDENIVKCGNPQHCPTAETCNGQDDDCDGIVDNAAGNLAPYSLAGCAQCTPGAESCDGCDQDCDSVADNGVAPVFCGIPLSATTPNWCQGTQSCKAQAAVASKNACEAGGPGNFWQACVYGNGGPRAETCNGLDDDCNGVVDDGITATTCKSPSDPGTWVYGGASQCKLGSLPCNGTCSGYVGPSAEICDGIDNDCDGIVDNNVPGVGNVCGTNAGICQKGTTACVGGALVCQGGVQPQPETCNGLDDNCNGVVDDQLTDAPVGTQKNCWTNAGNTCTYLTAHWSAPTGATCTGVGTLTTPCTTGQLACVTGGWACIGAQAPSTEVCNGVDDNCNGQVDETPMGGVGVACGSSTGACTLGTTACVAGAITCNGGTGPTAEVCDGIDNDCNGLIDDGPMAGTNVACPMPYNAAQYPGTRTGGVCKPGVDVCQNGKIVCIGGIAPSPELCDGLDNDCDGLVDETSPGSPPDSITGTADPANPTHVLGGACGSAIGACKAGSWLCNNGSVICNGAVGPTPEICDGVDNDCNGTVDDPGKVPGVGNLCGTSTPPCTKGTTACVAGALVCQGGTQPVAEQCDGVDNDCNGVIDDNLTDIPPNLGCWTNPGTQCGYKQAQWTPPPGANCTDLGTLTTPCSMGGLACVQGAWKCQADVEPSTEVCDGIDNNCNGQIDEGYVSTVCGQGCTPGVSCPCTTGMTQCSAGQITCVGNVGPQAELCNGIDDNCNGIVDDGINLNVPCDPAYDANDYPGARTFTQNGVNGTCKQGLTACGPGGTTICVGGIGPQPEICDGKDNDCDVTVDETGAAPNGIDGTENPATPGQHIGDACGSNVGACVQGHYACTNAIFTCVGGKGPQPETCDCLDNDCNGQIDDDPQAGDAGSTTPICGTSTPQKTCVKYQGICQCAPLCGSSEHPCPLGPYTCQNVPESTDPSASGNYCVESAKDFCGSCDTETIMLTGADGGQGAIECAPAGTTVDGGAAVPVCVCKGQLGCHKPCYNVTCSAPLLCTDFGPNAGTCQQDNCFNIPCPGTKVCNAGACEANPCDGVTCPSGEFCKPSSDFQTHVCEKSCAGVSCTAAQICQDGACVDTGCATPCPSGQVCAGADAGTDGGSNCVATKCADAGACPNGGFCDPLTGACGNDPCEGITCPTGQFCASGQCFEGASDGGTGGSGGQGGGQGGNAGSGGAAGNGGAAGGTGGEGGVTPGTAPAKGVFGLATGGGGCACETGPRSSSGTGYASAALFALGLVVARRRRRPSVAAKSAGGAA